MNAKQNTQPVEALTLSVTEAAALLGVHRNTVYQWIKTEAVPTLRIGPSEVRLRRRDVLALVEGEPVTRQAQAQQAAPRKRRRSGVA